MILEPGPVRRIFWTKRSYIDSESSMYDFHMNTIQLLILYFMMYESAS